MCCSVARQYTFMLSQCKIPYHHKSNSLMALLLRITALQINLVVAMRVCTAVKVGVPKPWKCTHVPKPEPKHAVYKEWPSSSSSLQGVSTLVHMLCTNWAHVYIFKQFPSLGTPTSTAVLFVELPAQNARA